MSQINIVLDIYSSVVCMIMMVYLLWGRGQRDRQRMFFVLMCAFNISMSLGDITDWVYTLANQPRLYNMLRVGMLVYWISSSLLLLSLVGYMIEHLTPKVRVHRNFWYGGVALAAAHVTGSVLSMWNGIFFSVTVEHGYQRGPLFWLSQLIPFMLYGLDIAIFVTYRKYLRCKDFNILSSYIFLPLAAEAIQMLNYGIALLNAAVALGLLIIFVNIQSEKELRLEHQEKELANARIDIMLSQIQPHFLYNSLTVIRRLCSVDPQKARDCIKDFSLFLRANMNSLTSKTPIPFEQEMKHTVSYLNLEQQRFQERLRVVYEIHPWEFLLPPLTLQPIVENAVRHGVLKKSEGGTVTIRTEEEEDKYCIIVQDDGVGFELETSAEGEHDHIGIANVRERLSIMCGGTLAIESKPGVGTTATITIYKEVQKR